MKPSSLIHVRRLLHSALTATKHRVARYLEAAGAKRPDDLADYGITASGAGSSSVEGFMLRELAGGDGLLEHPRASEEYARIEWNRFCQEANADSIAELKSDLRAHPADRGRLYVIGDGHFQDYRPKSAPGLQEDGTMIVHSLLARAAYAVHNPKANATSADADPFLCIAVAWHSGKRLFVRLVHIEFLTGVAVTNALAHASIISDVIRQLPRPVHSVILDSWYDDAKVRAWFRKRQTRVLHRLRLGPKGLRYMWIDGTRQTLQGIAENVAKDDAVKGKPLPRWGPGGKDTAFDVKRVFLRGVLGEADPTKIHSDFAHVETVELQVALKPGLRGPEIDWDHTSAVIINQNVKRSDGFAYFLRWTIESHFQVIVAAEAVTREQLAARMVVNFVTLATLVRMAVALRDVIIDLYPHERLGGVAVDRLATRSLINTAIVLDSLR